MRNNMNDYTLINEDRILRPVTIDDAEFIVKLRNQGHVKGFIHDTSLDVEKQRKWLREYFNRENEYYWIITTLDGTPYGTSSLYNYNQEKNQIEGGRWIRLPGYDCNMISGYIQMRDFVFDILNIDRVVNDVVSTNKRVIKYHKDILQMHYLGVRGIERGVAGEDVEVVCFEETRETWKENRARLLYLCGDMSKWKILKNNIELIK